MKRVRYIMIDFPRRYEMLGMACQDGDYKQDIEANQNGLEAAHHWGVPSCVYKSLPFFGQDRVETLRWQLTKDGLAA